MTVSKIHKGYSNSEKGSGSLSFDEDFKGDSIDRALFGKISRYMRAEMDLEEIENDPGLKEADCLAQEAINNYRKQQHKDKTRQDYINSNLAQAPSDTEIKREIQEVLREISEKNINAITSDWVKDWHRRHQGEVVRDVKSTEEIRNFISGSIENDTVEEPVSEINSKTVRNNKSRIIRYSALAIAAMISVFLLIRTLVPAGDPERIFERYFEPLPSVQNITRSSSDNSDSELYTGLESYRLGKYADAINILSKFESTDYSLNMSANLYLGVSYLHSGEYFTAISFLLPVAESKGALTKDAEWYLGLAYLANHDKENAKRYFKNISQTQGFYQDRSLEILRDLK